MLREISSNIQSAKYYTIMVDETGDVSNIEQLVLCLRWVDDSLQIHEDFIGLHTMKTTDADSIVKVIEVKNSFDLNYIETIKFWKRSNELLTKYSCTIQVFFIS